MLTGVIGVYQTVHHIRNASVVNITGNAAVAIAIEEGLIDPSSVIEVDGVKHAQAVKM